MSERHRFFFGPERDHPLHPLHEQAIEARVNGNYRVICGHCGVTLMGLTGHPGGITKIIWRHDGDTWFGTFTILNADLTPRTDRGTCTFCHGNDRNVPCAYPSEGKPGCLRDARLAVEFPHRPD